MAEEYIGNYKILKKIGAGGMAQVFLAVHKDVPNLKVVLKILSDARLVERFRQEADKLALLDGHSSVCRIKHFFNHGEEFVIAMEYIDGTTLDELIKKDGKLPVGDSLKIISDVLSTLEFAHRKDIFHRDIKPGNIMVDGMGQVKIIDFGIAKGKADPNLTVAGTSCGTPAYMPPEQFNPTESINYTLVDVYAVGTTLFYMLTGELPFKGDNQFALRDAKMFNDPARPRELNPDIPKKLEEVILKSLAKAPEDRYATAAEMQAAVDALRCEVGATEPAASRPAVKPPRQKSSSKIIPIIATVVVIALAVGGYLIFSGGPTLPRTPVPLTPESNAFLVTGTPDFSWQGSDQAGEVYIFEYAADSTFRNVIMSRELSATAYTPTEPIPRGDYFWRVMAKDSQGNKSEPSAIMPFIIALPPAAAKPEATLAITVRPRGDIYIDDNLFGQGQSEASVTLDTGWHDIRVVNQNSVQKSKSERIYLAGGAEENLGFEFTIPAAQPDKPAAAKVDSGDVIIGSRPVDGALVIIDGVEQEDRTNFTFRRPVGTHAVEVILTLDGEERRISRSIEFKKGPAAKEWFDFEK